MDGLIRKLSGVACKYGGQSPLTQLSSQNFFRVAKIQWQQNVHDYIPICGPQNEVLYTQCIWH